MNSASPLPDSGQLTFDFPDDPTSTDLFPSCSRCGSIDDLHLVEILRNEETFSLLCHSCRGGSAERLDTSIPLPLVSLNLFSRVLEIKGIVQVDASVRNYRKLLESEFSEYWEAQLKRKKSKQDSLFAPAGEANLFFSGPKVTGSLGTDQGQAGWLPFSLKPGQENTRLAGEVGDGRVQRGHRIRSVS